MKQLEWNLLTQPLPKRVPELSVMRQEQTFVRSRKADVGRRAALKYRTVRHASIVATNASSADATGRGDGFVHGRLADQRNLPPRSSPLAGMAYWISIPDLHFDTIRRKPRNPCRP